MKREIKTKVALNIYKEIKIKILDKSPNTDMRRMDKNKVISSKKIDTNKKNNEQFRRYR